MSRWIERLPDGTYDEGIIDPDQCRWLYNEVCCNDSSPICADYPDKEYCKRCKHFEKEQ